VSHLMLPFSRLSWRLKGSLSLYASTIVSVFVGLRLFGLEPPHRPFDLERANLSGHWLKGQNFRDANLSRANLSGANLSYADLSGATLDSADLSDANLSGAKLIDAYLIDANLRSANLRSANLRGANLSGAKLIDADLSDADLRRARNLTREQLDEACGDKNPKLSDDLKHDLTLNPCPR